jgi:multisubunit Na+/H+ antiporter MnhG subunit
MNESLPPVEQAKVFFFFLLLSIMIPIVIGVLLLLVTAWGLYRMRDTHEFSYIDTVRIIHRGFVGIVAVGLVLIAMASKNQEVIAFALMIYPMYSFLFSWLFYNPLSKHKEWVVANGIFSTTTPAEPKYARTAPWISFGNTPSIADELIKLNSLKEANLITLDEFNTLRSKLLS